jgi:plastocyanin
MARKLKLFGMLFLFPWLVIGVFGSRYVGAATAAPQTWNVLMGQQLSPDQNQKPAVQAYSFYPDNITIHEGDTVTWKHNSDGEPHTVTFLGPGTTLPSFFANVPSGPPPQLPSTGPFPSLPVNPQVVFPAGGNSYDGSAFTSSGAIAQNIPGPQTYSLMFPKAGTYKYVCLIHTEQYPDGSASPMVGTITVVAADQPLPMTPAQVEAAGQADLADDAAIATGSQQAAMTVPPDSPGPNGTTIHHVNVGYTVITPDNDWVDHQRFYPETLTINQGDTVEWSVPTDKTAHTVLFGEPNAAALNVEPQPAGPPKVTTPFEVFFPVGGPVNNGSGVYSSGFIQGPKDPPGPFAHSYSLTFTKPGTYNYVCGLHNENGMKGTIIVRASSTVPGMPTTGAGDMLPYIMLGGVAAAALLILGGLWLARGRKAA